MKAQEELNLIDIDVDYDDEQSIVEGFLKLSAMNRMREFNFEDAFRHLGMYLQQKLVEHAQNCELDEFRDYQQDMGMLRNEHITAFTYSSGYILIDEDDVRNAICGMWYEKSKQAFDGMFDDLIEIATLSSAATNNESERQANVILFDRVIHAQHVTGDIFEYLDIEDVKADLDEEILELMGIEMEVA